MPKVDMRAIKERSNTVMRMKIGRLFKEHFARLHMPQYASNKALVRSTASETPSLMAYLGWGLHPTICVTF